MPNLFCIFCRWLGAGCWLYLHGAIDPGVLGCTNGCALRGHSEWWCQDFLHFSLSKVVCGLQAVSLLDQSCSAQAGEIMGCWIGVWGFATVDTFSLSGWSSTCTISRSASRMVVARGYFGRVVEDARDKTSTTLEADGCNDGSCWTSLPNISWIWCRASSLGCHPLLFQTAEPIILL